MVTICRAGRNGRHVPASAFRRLLRCSDYEKYSVVLRYWGSKRYFRAHQRDVPAHSDEFVQFAFAFRQMHGGLAAAAIANAWIAMHRFQRIPALATPTSQAASFNVDAQPGDRGHRIFRQLLQRP